MPGSSDAIPANTTYVANSTTLNGAATANINAGALPINSPAAPAGQLNVGAAQAAVVTFRVTINTPLPLNVTQISNQATANGNGPGGAVPPAPSEATRNN